MALSLTPEQRTLRARAAAYALHAQGGTNTGPATAARFRRFEDEVDPEGVLTPEERARRAKLARKSYMVRLALKRSRAQARKKAAAVMDQSAAAESTGGTRDAAPTV